MLATRIDTAKLAIVAQATGMTVPTVQNIESVLAKTSIRADHMYALSQLAGVKMDFIQAGDISDSSINRQIWEKVREKLLSEYGVMYVGDIE